MRPPLAMPSSSETLEQASMDGCLSKALSSSIPALMDVEELRRRMASETLAQANLDDRLAKTLCSSESAPLTVEELRRMVS